MVRSKAPHPSPLPEGEGTDLGVFEFSGDQSGCRQPKASPHPSPLPEGEGTDLSVFEFSGDQSGCSKPEASPHPSPLPEGEGTDLCVFEFTGDQSGCSKPEASPNQSLSRREKGPTYVFSSSAVISQAAANLKHPPIGPLSLWERARVRGFEPYARFSCIRANWRSSMEG